MDGIRVRTPFCGAGNLRSVAIAAGFIYLIIALAGITTGFSYKPMLYGYGFYGENYLLFLLGTSSVVWIIANILLLHGAFTKQHKFLLPWIYWHLVFVVIALVVLIWSSTVIGKLGKFKSVQYEYTQMRASMIAALSCVVPFLCTVIYFSIIVYSFYCDLKDVKLNEDIPDVPDSPRRPVITVLRPGSNISTGVPFVQPLIKEEDIYTNVPPQNVRNDSALAAALAERDDQFVTYYTLPDRHPDT